MDRLLSAIERVTRAAITFAEVSGPRRSVLILLLALVALVPGLASLPPTDRDEARFVQATKQMMETGDYIDIRLQEEPRWKKPVGIYWMQAAAAWLYGGPEAEIRAYRIPSAIGALAAALLAGWAFFPLLGPRGATLAGVMTATATIVVAEGHIAKTDAMLLATTVAAQGALLRLWLTPRRAFSWMHMLFWAALGLGILIKGPVILIFVGGTLLWLSIWERRASLLGDIRPFPGLLIMLAIALPWYVLIYLETQGAFFEEALLRDFLGKITEGQELHWGPPGYYLATIWGTAWPWAPMLLLAAPFAWRTRNQIEGRFLLAWIVPAWIAFALTATKLPHYILPLVPALMGLIAAWLVEAPAGLAGKGRRALAAGVFGVVGGALALAAIAGLPVIEGKVSFAAVTLGGIALVLVAAGARALYASRRIAFFGAAVAAALALYPALFGFVLPRLDTGFPSPRIAAAHAGFANCTDRPLVSVGYREPSLVFAAGTETRLPTVEEAARMLREEDGWLVYFTEHRGVTLSDFTIAVGTPVTEYAEVTGFNINRGDPFTAVLLGRQGDPALTDCPVTER
ncbi:MAG: glycosyltransferase family 39 protein [Pseudomonadota bacterium]